MKLAIAGIAHETNCFSPVPTPLPDWRCWEGEQMFTMRGTKTALGGVLEVADREGWEILPCLYANATPSAPTDPDTYANLRERVLAPMRRETPDAVILILHGAMVAQGTPDPESDLTGAVRELIGDRPLVIELDLHGNNTPATAANVNAVFGYDTNPHIDMYERAVEAAECMARLLKGEIAPVTAWAHAHILPSTINMRTAEGPMVELFTLAREWEAKPGMINVSVFGGFPYGDEAYSGTTVIATADGDKALAQAACDAITARAWEIREQFLKELGDIPACIEKARELLAAGPVLPVILADVADNAGGGGSADTPELLRALIAADIPGTACALIWDPETVQKAMATGIGNSAVFTIGGKAEPAYGAPVVVEARVKALSDGVFTATGPMYRGTTLNIGPAARLQVGNVQILVSSIRNACNDADIFRNLGVEPTQQRLLQVKSRGHFRASFEPLSSTIVEVDAPGAANPNLSRYSYKNIAIWPLTR